MKRPTTIRLSPAVHALASRAAAEDGVSLAAWIGEAALYRAAYRQALRDQAAGAGREYASLTIILRELGYTVEPPPGR